jgi:hypothetical protein
LPLPPSGTPEETWRRQIGQWQLRDGNHYRHPLGAIDSVTLSDGGTVEVGIELEQAIDELGQPPTSAAGVVNPIENAGAQQRTQASDVHDLQPASHGWR